MNPALVIVVVIACLVAIGVGAYFLLKGKKPDSDSVEVALEVPSIEDPLPALVENPLPAIEAPLPAMVSVQGWPVVSPSDPIAPVSPEAMAATTWADDLTTMPAEIPVEASTAELDLARADPTQGLFPSTADLKAQDQGAQQVAPVDAPAPVLAPVLAPAPTPAPAQAKAKAKANGCGGTRIWDGKVCRERSVKPVAAAGKLDVPPVTIPTAKSKGCGPGKKWDGKACRPPKGRPAPEGDGKAARKAARDAERRNRDDESSNDESSDESGAAKSSKKCKLGNTAKYDYTTKIESSPNQYDWHCPSGYKSTGCDWGIGPDAPNEKRHCRKRKTSSTATPKSKSCGAGKIWDGKVCRAPKNPSPTTPNAGSQLRTPTSYIDSPTLNGEWNRDVWRNNKKPGSGGCPPGRSRDPKTKDCRPTAGLKASQKRVADAENIRAVQRQSPYIQARKHG